MEEFYGKDAYKKLIRKYNMESLYPNLDSENNVSQEEIVINDGYDGKTYDESKDNRITSFIMTQAEFTRVVSERAKQIENGSYVFVDIEDEVDPELMAIKEIKQKKCPLCIERVISVDSRTIKEIWRVNEMSIPFK
jgi:DNA-directed RNA polymerase subunit K/omega